MVKYGVSLGKCVWWWRESEGFSGAEGRGTFRDPLHHPYYPLPVFFVRHSAAGCHVEMQDALSHTSIKRSWGLQQRERERERGLFQLLRKRRLCWACLMLPEVFGSQLRSCEICTPRTHAYIIQHTLRLESIFLTVWKLYIIKLVVRSCC